MISEALLSSMIASIREKQDDKMKETRKDEGQKEVKEEATEAV